MLKGGLRTFQLAELPVSLNSIVVKAGLDPQREILREKITRCELLTASEKKAILALLAQMPEGDCFCHGDFHPGNILLAHGRFSIIDWIDASRGRPAADLARGSILFLGHIANSPRFSQKHRAMELFHIVYLALAEREKCELWTADASFASIASASYPLVRRLMM